MNTYCVYRIIKICNNMGVSRIGVNYVSRACSLYPICNIMNYEYLLKYRRFFLIAGAEFDRCRI